MAHPHDIEDVLSSIRRLVANDSGAATARKLEEAPAPERPVEALILDPAHRVIDPEDPFQMIRSLAQEERDGRDAEFFMEAVEEEVTAITSDIVIDELVAEVIWTEAEPVTPDYVEDTDYQASEEGDDLEAAVPVDLPEEEALPENGAAEWVDAAPVIAEELEAPAPELHDEEAGPAAAVEPEQTAQDDVPDSERAAERDGDPEDVDLADLSEHVASDGALRDLIAEIVRQELSGALGERITRNVRKLVRREIRQMLSSGEFD